MPAANGRQPGRTDNREPTTENPGTLAIDARRGAFTEFDALFRHVPFGAGLIDRDLRYVRVNQALADFNGRSIEEHLGRTIHEVIPEFADEVEPILRGVLETGSPGPVVDSRLPLPGRPSVTRAIRIRFFPVEQDGAVTHVGAIFADIEDQWRAQDTLRASEERFRTVFEAAPSGIVMTDGAGRITLVNQEVERAFGYTRAELLGRPANLLLPGLPPGPGVGDGNGPAPRVSRDLAAHRADGTSFPVDVALTPLPGGATLATVSDVTERKRTEDALREREAEARRLALVAARTTNGVVITDDQGRTEWINEGFVRLTGFDIEDLRGRRPGDVLQVPGTDPATVEYIRECVTGRVPFAAEVLNRRKDGTLFWVRVDAAPLFADDGTFTGYITIQSDVTERREADDALRASEERYRAFIALATEGVYRFEAEGDLEVTLPPAVQVESILRGARLAECNDAFARMYGLERAEDLIGRPLKTFLPTDDPQSHAILQQFVERGYTLSEVETRERGSGRYFSNALFGVVENGLLVRAWGIQRDVTAQRRAEEALRDSEERFRLALEGGRMGTFDWDLVTDGLVVDEREAELCGRPQAELTTGDAFFAGVHPEDVEPLRAAVSVALVGEGDYATEFRYIRPDGDVRWLAGRGHVMLEGGRPVRMMGLNFDVTERRRAEEELRRRTLEMEQFTYTVSHDLKSPLVTITGFLGMLETHVEAGRPERARVAVDRIRRAAGRMSELIDDLLELSRVGRVRGEITAVDVNALVEEVADGLRRRLAAARCRFRVRSPLPTVRADARRLAEAFENLITNALKYACVAGATRVEVWSEIVDEEVRYVVEDDGPGIPPEYHKTIFDLFQRLGGPEAEGTGMGLAIVSKIMEVHDGRAWVESGPGEGARFYLAFPRTALVTAAAPSAAPPSDP